jgi:hypothetical protein
MKPLVDEDVILRSATAFRYRAGTMSLTESHMLRCHIRSLMRSNFGRFQSPTISMADDTVTMSNLCTNL